MLRINRKNMVIALCVSCALIALALYKRLTASAVPVEVFYVVGAAFFLLRCSNCRKQCGA